MIPVASFTMSQTSGIAPLTVRFTDTSTNSPSQWFWDFGDGTSSTLQNPTHTFSAGTYVVYLTASNSWGSRRSPQSTGLVVAYMSDSFTATPLSGPASLTVQFTDTSRSSPTGWWWKFGDGSTSNQQNPTHTYNISGVFIVTLDVVNQPSAGSDPNNPATTTITVLSPLTPGSVTTSPTLTITSAVSSTQTTSITTGTVSSITHTVTATPTGYYFTASPTDMAMKTFTPIPTNTPTPRSSIGIVVIILAICVSILVIRRQS
jgi:PKD repeat protein